jgi:hypothetical protein
MLSRCNYLIIIDREYQLRMAGAGTSTSSREVSSLDRIKLKSATDLPVGSVCIFYVAHAFHSLPPFSPQPTTPEKSQRCGLEDGLRSLLYRPPRFIQLVLFLNCDMEPEVGRRLLLPMRWEVTSDFLPSLGGSLPSWQVVFPCKASLVYPLNNKCTSLLPCLLLYSLSNFSPKVFRCPPGNSFCHS